MRFEIGSLYPWPGFELVLERALELVPGCRYKLEGANGSGKSSFLTQILLPRLLQNPDHQYLLYFQQQMHLQSFAIRAAASLSNYPGPLIVEKDYISYLLHDLDRALTLAPRPTTAIIDESGHPDYIIDHLKHLDTQLSIFWVDHHKLPHEDDRLLVFEPVSSYKAILYEK